MRKINLLDEVRNFDLDIDCALVLTYSFDPKIFESDLLPLLLRKNCHNITVMMDKNNYQSIKSEKKSRKYFLIGNEQAVLFHPKLYLFAGSANALLLIGSGNLTKNGLGGFAEIFARFELSSSPSIVQQLVSFLESAFRQEYVRKCSALESRVLDIIQELKGMSPEPATGIDSSIRLLHSYGSQCLWHQLLNSLGNEKAVSIQVISPFYEVDGEDPSDASGSLFESIFRSKKFSLKPKDKPLKIYFRNEVGHHLPKTTLKRFEDYLQLYNFSPKDEEVGRTLHGKAVILHTARRSLILVGSANFTPAALLKCVNGDGKKGNSEISVLYTLHRKLAKRLINENLINSEVFVPIDDIEDVPEPTSPKFRKELPPFAIISAVLYVTKRSLEVRYAYEEDAPVDSVKLLARGANDEKELDSLEWDKQNSMISKDGLDDSFLSNKYGTVKLMLFCGTTRIAEDISPIDLDSTDLVDVDDNIVPLSLEDRIYKYRGTIYLSGVRSIEHAADKSSSSSSERYEPELDSFHRKVYYGLRGLRKELRRPHSANRVLRDVEKLCFDTMLSIESKRIEEYKALFILCEIARLLHDEYSTQDAGTNHSIQDAFLAGYADCLLYVVKKYTDRWISSPQFAAYIEKTNSIYDLKVSQERIHAFMDRIRITYPESLHSVLQERLSVSKN